jgi:hypothetical protein
MGLGPPRDENRSRIRSKCVGADKEGLHAATVFAGNLRSAQNDTGSILIRD